MNGAESSSSRPSPSLLSKSPFPRSNPAPLTPRLSTPPLPKLSFSKSSLMVKVKPPVERILATPPLKRSLRIAETTKAKRMRAGPKISRSSNISSSQGESNSDVAILTIDRRRSLARRQTFSDTSDDLKSDNAESGSLGNNNAVDDDVDMDTEAKSNLDDNMTDKDDNDFREDDPIINIEDLFQQVRDQTACERLTREIMEQTCRFFQHSMSKMSLSDRVPIRGLKCGLRPFQALGVFCMFLVEVTTLSGGILADDMRLGKTVQCLAKFVCTRWLFIINNDIQQTRETGHLTRHLPPLDPNNLQSPDAQCPSQKRWPIQCCYVERGSSRNFRVSAGPAMALVPSKLLGNWAKEWDRFIDVNDTLLNFKLLIGHSQAKSDETLTGHVQAGLAIDPNSTPAQAASRFLVLTTPGSYKSNVAKALERTFHSSYVPLGRKRAVQRLEAEQRDV
ncbi:hypothetical protein MMC31_004503 [Peltigera leucophlebia]|nr:hypothetical protein [Peltigera leucophlebia]